MPNPASGGDDIRLNLAQQKKRAKDLARAIAAGEQQAVARFARHHPKPVVPAAARLSDAQLVIARELGLPSWPKLKAHAEHLERARAAIAAGGPAPDGERATVHIRCGDDIRDGLAAAGFGGDFLKYADPYCQGPVPADADLLAVRAGFISAAYGRTRAEAERRLAAEYAALAAAPERYGRLVLWFEHDSYDQLILARILALLAALPLLPAVELICIDRFPTVERFKGLGQLSTVALRSLWESRSPVTAAQLRLGAAVWPALQQPTPAPLLAIARGGTPEVPPMAGALLRHLQELPWTQDGLSLTQRLALEALAEAPRRRDALFAAAQEREPLPFLGDDMFFAVLADMGRVDPAPFSAREDGALALTATGETLLAGRLDWLSLGPPERWVGGVRVALGAPQWRWPL